MRPQFKSRTMEKHTLNCAFAIPGLKCPRWLLLLAASFAACSSIRAQSDSVATKPYATLDRQSVSYQGPTRAIEKDIPDGAAVIGMILPLRGPQESEGKALLAAAQLALEAEQLLGPLPDGRRLVLVVRDESGPWGQASSEILKLIEQDHALVLLTSANGNSAHLAEQIANKISIPILTLSSDPTTTQANVPWLFRLGPSDTDQAYAFCQRIYTHLGLRKVLLIVQKDHDGSVGGAEFEKAARNLKVVPPIRLEISDSASNLEPVGEMLQTEGLDAIVVWTDAPLAEKLLPLIHQGQPSTPVFLCRKAAQLSTESGSDSGNAALVSAREPQSSGVHFTVRSLQQRQEAGQAKFQQLYLAQTGTTAGIAATEVYEAVHVIAAALRSAGASRALLRDYFANTGRSGNTTGIISFDPAGNSVQEFAIVKLRTSAGQ